MPSTPDEDRHGRLLSLFSFYKDAGVEDAVAAAPIDRFAAAEPPGSQSVSPPMPSAQASPQAHLPEKAAQPARAARAASTPRAAAKPAVPDDAQAALAREQAAGAATLDALREAMNAFNGCNLKYTAKQAVFADGNPDSGLMLVGEAPGRDEDIEGLPFVGRSGKLLDRMLAAIGVERASGAYLANVLPWRPPGNRTPTPQETEICRPFIERQIELADPKVLVALGGSSAKVLLRSADGILRLRGNWRVYRTSEGKEIPILPTLHPAYLLRNGAQKKLAWRDFLELKAKLRSL
jgi:uracil-DNA glycosylase